MAQFRHFDVRHCDDINELCLADTTFFDVREYGELQDELLAFVEMYRPKQLVVNFDRVKYCSTALIAGVLHGRSRLDAIGGDLVLCGMCEPVRDTFRMLKLDDSVFHIYESEPDAVAALC